MTFIFQIFWHLSEDVDILPPENKWPTFYKLTLNFEYFILHMYKLSYDARIIGHIMINGLKVKTYSRYLSRTVKRGCKNAPLWNMIKNWFNLEHQQFKFKDKLKVNLNKSTQSKSYVLILQQLPTRTVMPNILLDISVLEQAPCFKTWLDSGF